MESTKIQVVEDYKNDPTLQAIASKLAEAYRQNLIDDGVSGSLKDFTYEWEQDGSTYKLVFEVSSYYWWEERGRSGRNPIKPEIQKRVDAKNPPYEPIADWLRRKKMIPYTEQTFEDIAWGLTWRIGIRGTEGKYTLTRTLNDAMNSQDFGGVSLASALGKTIEDTFIDIITDRVGITE